MCLVALVTTRRATALISLIAVLMTGETQHEEYGI